MKSAFRTWALGVAAALSLWAGVPFAGSDNDGTARIGSASDVASLTFSTYLGGNDIDVASAVAVDRSGNIYVTGWTSSTSMPVLSAFQSSSGGGVDAFVAKFDSLGGLLYCTYLGGGDDDRGFGIAVDNAGNAYVTGWTSSSDFPIRGNGPQRVLAGGLNAFVAKVGPGGDTLVYSTYLGGFGSDQGRGIALDASGNVYVAGQTTSWNFPTLHPLQSSLMGLQNGFVAGLDASGALRFATYFGGSGTDGIAAIAVDDSGLYITGSTDSPNFPTCNPFQAASGGFQDAFVAKLSPNGAAIVFSTYLGGSGGSAVDYPESGLAIDVDSSGSAYVSGVTSSVDFPIQHALQPRLAGWVNAFVTKFGPTGMVLEYSTYLGGINLDYGNAIRVDGVGNACIAGYSTSTDFPVVNPVQAGPGGSYDAFVSCLNASGDTLISSTLLGGSESDGAFGLAIGGGFIHVVGETASSDFPLQRPFQSSRVGQIDAFVAKFPIPCNYVVTPATATPGASAGTGLVNVAVPGGCSWTATSNNATWLTAIAGTSGSGGGTVSYSVAANPNASARSATLTIAGQTFTVTQSGTGCTYSINPTEATVGASGSVGAVSVAAPGGCSWTATSSDASWIAITSGSSGSGNGTINYLVSANASGPARVGSMAIAGSSWPVSQAAGCAYSLTPTSRTVTYYGGDGLTFGLTTSAVSCAWTVTTPVGWLKALPDTGTGNGTIYYSVYPNYSSVTRSAALGLGGQSFTTTQTGAPGSRDERFVQLLYLNFYGRRPSAGEVAFQVTNGVGPYGRAQVALNFFNGREFLDGGRFIVGLYFGLLEHAPDYNGFVFQRNAMARNIVDPMGLVTNVINGAEFQLKYGTLTDTAFVTLLYNQILLRAPDPQGLIDQVNGIHRYGRTQIAYNMLNSPEFQITTGPQMSAYLLNACLLQRNASSTETNVLVSQIQQGATFLSLISTFISASEFGQLLR